MTARALSPREETAVRRTPLRAVAGRAAAMGVVTGALILSVAPMAFADTGADRAPRAAGGWAVDSPAPGSTLTTDGDQTVAIGCPQAGCDSANGAVSVTVGDPRAPDAPCESLSFSVAPSNGQLVADQKLALGHPYGAGCGALQGAPGYNGTWTVTARDSNGVLATGTFVVKAPPAAPGTPTAASGANGVTVTWPVNPEPDTFAYGVTVDGKGAGSPVRCAFTDKSCSETIPVGPGKHDIAVVAVRHTSPGTEDYVAGPVSPTTSVTVAAEPSASATPSHQPSASAPPTASAAPTRNAPLPSSVNLPTTTSRGLGGDFFTPTNPLGPLPSLTTGGGHVVPSATPTADAAADEGPDGPYGKLGYGDQAIVTSSQREVDAGGVVGNLASALGVSAVTAAACICGGLLALLGALHLALWTRRAPIS